MRKFGSPGLKILITLHFLMVVLFLRGILSSFARLIKLDLSNYADVYMNYEIFNIISHNIVKIGAQGIAIVSAVYGFFTRWGFIKYKWLAVKWALFIIQTFVGIFVVDKLMVTHTVLLGTENARALSHPTFLHNH